MLFSCLILHDVPQLFAVVYQTLAQQYIDMASGPDYSTASPSPEPRRVLYTPSYMMLQWEIEIKHDSKWNQSIQGQPTAQTCKTTGAVLKQRFFYLQTVNIDSYHCQTERTERHVASQSLLRCDR